MAPTGPCPRRRRAPVPRACALHRCRAMRGTGTSPRTGVLAGILSVTIRRASLGREARIGYSRGIFVAEEEAMKLLFFDDYKLGVLNGDTVVDVSNVVRDIPHVGPHDLINGLIERF